MDDSCAVCAEPLEWVAFGPCGHRDVCSTCIARLRFICDDRRCCICKTESNMVFVTKALGDYTKTLDFSTLPSEVREGKIGLFWFHEGTQAFFDDIDQYRMIKAMCKLSCSVCDSMEDQPQDGSRRRPRFRNIEQLKGHLFHKHKLQMCTLCLEGRKVFICEQKLYTRSQLNQHIRSGDSEVDGSESERGGFAGHPICEFCRTPFYGDNELYLHMSTEHYTCHICQRQHPGQYEYYRNYDDLEVHFRGDHFLCEDEACLAKKFVVFSSAADLKRHNALEHGGHMSRSQRNAVLQIPTSFRYRRSNESVFHRGRGRGRGRGLAFRRESSSDNDHQLDLAIQASLEAASEDSRDPSSSAPPQAPENEDRRDIDPLVQPFESLATTDSERSSRYLQAASHNSPAAPLGESAFPPLAATPGSTQQKTQSESIGTRPNTMAACLRRKNNVAVLNVGQAWPGTSRGHVMPPSSSLQSWPAVNNVPTPSTASSQNKPATNNGPSLSGYSISVRAQPVRDTNTALGRAWGSRNGRDDVRMKHSSSASELSESSTFDPVSDFPPVMAVQSHKPSTSAQDNKAEDIQTANKSLVEKIRVALDNDEDKYTAFKDISQEYRQGTVDARAYLNYVKQFGLSHLVLDLARLCPDGQKQRELIEVHNTILRGREQEESAWGNGSIHVKKSSSSKKAKGKGKKVVDSENISSKDALADNVIDTVRKLQSSYKPSDEVEVLEKDGYRGTRGKSKEALDERPFASVDTSQAQVLTGHESPSRDSGASQNNIDGGVFKKGKKTSKFLRVRLGGSSSGDPSPDLSNDAGESQHESSGLPARGAWRNMGGQKLLATAPRRT